MVDLNELLLVADQDVLADLVAALEFVHEVRVALSYVLDDPSRYQFKRG